MAMSKICDRNYQKNQAYTVKMIDGSATNAAIYALQNQNLLRGKCVAIKQGEGLAVRQGTVASVNDYGFIVDFVVI